ncbi:MAG: 6-carboxytetrahydropterin synthase, partial [Alphaproteobacteria bacterium]|nr:6-carboxytetrahydropterin synthase [Alphaproteobacteria bacterium]
MFTLVFSRRYAMAHRLRHDTSEKCVIPHGHNEIVTVRLAATHSAPLDGAANVITPFDDAKSRWHEWIDAHVDHALQLALDDPLLGYFVTAEPERVARIMTLPGDPTTEILAACFMAKLNAFLDADGAELMCEEVTIEETPTNQVVFAGDPAKVLPQVTDREHWWQR